MDLDCPKEDQLMEGNILHNANIVLAQTVLNVSEKDTSHCTRSIGYSTLDKHTQEDGNTVSVHPSGEFVIQLTPFDPVCSLNNEMCDCYWKQI